MNNNVNIFLSVWNGLAYLIKLLRIITETGSRIGVAIFDVALVLYVHGTSSGSFFVTTGTIAIPTTMGSFHFVHCITAALPSAKRW